MASSSWNPEWPRSTQTHSPWKIRWTTLKHLDWFLMPLVSSCDQTRWKLSGAGAQAVPSPQCGAVHHMLWLLGGAVPIVFSGFHRFLWPYGICGGQTSCGLSAGSLHGVFAHASFPHNSPWFQACAWCLKATEDSRPLGSVEEGGVWDRKKAGMIPNPGVEVSSKGNFTGPLEHQVENVHCCGHLIFIV